MDEKPAYCGLICEKCPIYVATRIDDPVERETKRVEIARICVEQYGMDYAPEDITDCDGCLNDGRIFSECADCVIRKCARARGVENCAHCDDYACEILLSVFENEPQLRENLEKIRAEMGL